MKNSKAIISLNFIIIMIALGASDAMRGIFASIFQSHFGLSTSQISLIVTVSYIGNLVFLSLGGYLLDKYKRKTVAIGVWLMWMSAGMLYLLTDNYICLLIGMFFAMGASTLMNTTINILTPTLFATPGLMVNLFFFTQGIGTSGSQAIVGRFANGFGAWKIVNVVFLVFGVIALFLLFTQDIPDAKQKSEKKSSSPASLFISPIFLSLVLCFGFYFIAEHGIMNWLITYCDKALQIPMKKASVYLSIFWGGMTIGRLLFAPVVQKLGVYKSIGTFGAIGATLFVIGIITGKNGILILSISGLILSILYPTMVLMIQKIYPQDIAATATGWIISIATLFDITFNAFFGKIIDTIGYRNGFMILPLCMIAFIGCYFVMVRKKGVQS